MRRLFQYHFPAQFWLMFVGMLFSTIGSSMIWPFLMIYVSKRLNQPLSVNASLLTLNSIAGLTSSLIAGPIIDRLGRKRVMVISLLTNSLGYVLLSHADSMLSFAVLMIVQGASNPLYRIGADAMMADLIPPEKRVDAYSMMRLSNNLGVSIGPAIGGIVASVSYQIAFYCAAVGLSIYGLLMAFLARETLPQLQVFGKDNQRAKELPLGGYQHIFHDTRFVLFILAFLFTNISASIMWVLLSVYAKTNYGVLENIYGFIPVTNALMVVFFQLPVTSLTRRFKTLPVIAVGALFYAVGVGSVALGSGFLWFWGSMVIMTIGELIIVPTSSTYVANLAPTDMRGRYMSLYGLTGVVANGVGPVAGGFLNDH
ncbi:MAG: MDR family MFS transporter, partial [Anaerolineales bacterium]